MNPIEHIQTIFDHEMKKIFLSLCFLHGLMGYPTRDDSISVRFSVWMNKSF